MILLGAAVNAAAIFVGGGLGLLLKKGLSERLKDSVLFAMALCVMAIGIKGAIQSQNMLVMVLSMAIGTLIGELINIDGLMNRFGSFLQKKLTKKDSDSTFGEGFITTTLYVCVGAMAIVGAIEAGMKGSFDTYYTKSMLDGVAVFIFSASMGAGCLLSGFVVLLYEGLMSLGAGFVASFLTESIINEMSAVGSLIIIAISLNMLKITKFKIGNMVLATFMPILICQFI